MAIVRMANKREEIPAGATNIKDVSDRWRPAVDTKPDGYWTSEKAKEFTLFTYETHNGLCIRERERNGYDDSDFYMTVWNPEKKAPEEIEFASTRGWSYPCYASYVDATPEVRAEFEKWEAEANRKAAEERAAREAVTPRKGKILKVVKGRSKKVPIGTTGVCIWTGKNKFDRSRWGRNEVERVGIKDASGNVYWTAAGNVEVVLGGPEEGAYSNWGGRFNKADGIDEIDKAISLPPSKANGAVLWDKRESVETKQSAWYDHTFYRVPVIGKPDIGKFTSELHRSYVKGAGSLIGSSVGGYCTLGSVKDNGDGTWSVEEIYHIGD